MEKQAVLYVNKSKIEDSLEVTLQRLLQDYESVKKKTGDQLGWAFEHRAFPYTIERISHDDHEGLLLQGKNKDYHQIELVTSTPSTQQPLVYINLHEKATHGDLSKAIELAKFIAERICSKLQLFNGRVMTYQPVKK
ncbi:DUF1885 family protein [Thalassobacillus sp. CUG 92003]|uniref:DUF1885 family protein n=1 Tax=Thalassobacillus sp. CUG 92003 TaxID=2736641 RepID=UPI0015E6EEB0